MFGVVLDKLEDRHRVRFIHSTVHRLHPFKLDTWGTSDGGQRDQATCNDSRARARALVAAGYGSKLHVEERQAGQDKK